MTVARSRIHGRRAGADDRLRHRELDPGVSFRPHLNLANLITTIGLAAGLSAGLLAASHGYALSDWSLWELTGLILVAVLADLADGSAARHFGTDKDPFGHGLDSLADTVSFAAVPALAVYAALLHRAPAAGFLTAVMWGICGAGRLARYMRRGHRPGYIGCPAPLAAMVLMLLTAAVRQIAGEATAGAYLVLAAAVTLSVLMVSGVPVPGPGELVNFVRRRGQLTHDDTDALLDSPAPGPVRVSR